MATSRGKKKVGRRQSLLSSFVTLLFTLFVQSCRKKNLSMKAEKKTDKQVELYSKRKLNKLNVSTAGSAVTQPKVSQESKNPAKRAPRKSDTDNHGILEGISSLHTWIKTQTMIRLVPAAFFVPPSATISSHSKKKGCNL